MFGLKFGGQKGAAQANPEFEGEYLTVRLNARVQPMDRGEYFEDPLNDTISTAGIGEVTGGGTQLADEPAGIEYCDLEVCVANSSDETLMAIIRRLEALGAPKGSKLIVETDGREIWFGEHEGLAVFLNGVDLDDRVYAECDVNHIIDEFNRLMGDAGQFRSHWEGSRETALYCYGPSFQDMKAAIAPFIASYPLCEKARIEQIA